MSELVITWRSYNDKETCAATGTYYGYSTLANTLMLLVDNGHLGEYIQHVSPDKIVSIKPVGSESPSTREQFKSLPAGTVFTLVREEEGFDSECKTLFKPDDESVYAVNSRGEFISIDQDSDGWNDWEILSIYNMITPL